MKQAGPEGFYNELHDTLDRLCEKHGLRLEDDGLREEFFNNKLSFYARLKYVKSRKPEKPQAV